MRGLLLAAGAILALSAVTHANAADSLPKAPAKTLSFQAPYNWTGFYLGGNGGFGWSQAPFTNTITGTMAGVAQRATIAGTDRGRGGFGGGQIGYNYQFLGNWVAGIEADIDAASITSSAAGCSASLGPAVLCGVRNTDVKDFGTVRGRLGRAFDNVLVYGTAGWAWSRDTNTAQVTCIGPRCPGTSAVPATSPAPASIDLNPNGWAAGGGIEWGFLPHWTLRAEYLHLQFNGLTEDRSKPGFFPNLVIASHVSSNLSIDVARLGINYLFSWGAPPVVK